MPEPIEGVRLTAATRQLGFDCGPEADCPGTITEATLSSDTDDIAARRTIDIAQFFDAFEFKAIERTAGDEDVSSGRVL